METSLIQKILIIIGLACAIVFLFKIISKMGITFLALGAGVYIGYVLGKKQ